MIGIASLALARRSHAQGTSEGDPMVHVALLGDSVFDNAAYVGQGPDVIGHLRTMLPEGSRASLLALDGSTLDDVPRQLDRVPREVTHLVVSSGGNDALGYSSILSEPSSSVAETVEKLAHIQEQFRADYGRMTDMVLARIPGAAFCTIYDPRFPDPIQRRLATTALSLLNDGILRAAAARRASVLDLRIVCDDDADFANPIEPSVQGGRKIASAIAAFLDGERSGRQRRSEIFVE